PAPEQALEEIAEAAARAAAGKHLVEIEAARARAATAAEACRRNLVARAVAACAQLVVGLAALGIAQRLVGLVDGLEPVLGLRLLAHVGVILARHPAIGGLDLRIAGIGLHAQHVVVILELHDRSTTTARVMRAVASLPVDAEVSARSGPRPGSGAAWFPGAWGSRSRARRRGRWRRCPRHRRCRAARSGGGSCRSGAPRASSARFRCSI